MNFIVAPEANPSRAAVGDDRSGDGDLCSPEATLDAVPAASEARTPGIPSSDGQRAPENACSAAKDWWNVTRRFASGDTGAFGEFYDAFFDLMYREARRLSGRDENTCLDLVHESMLKAIRAVRPTSSEGQLRVWCRTLVKSVTYDWLRRESRRKIESLPTDHAALPGNSAADEREVRWRWIEEQIAAEPPELRRLFALRYRWGWTLERIAMKVGLKTGAVDGKLRRALEQMRAKARDDFEES